MLCVTFCLVENIWQSQDVSNLTPPGPSKAILPNDMISVKELHTALGGMDTVLLCLQNKMKVEPIVNNAWHCLCANWNFPLKWNEYFPQQLKAIF